MKAILEVVKRILLAAIVIAVLLVVLSFVLEGVFEGFPIRVDSSFATKAILDDRTVVTDAKDVKDLKSMLSGWAQGHSWSGEPFSDCGTSLTLTNGRDHIAFRTCVERYYFVEVFPKHRFLELTPRQWNALDRICKKYGTSLPQ